MKSNEIEVTLWHGPKTRIDPYTIHHTNPGLHECVLHFDDGSSIRIKETQEELTKLIQRMEREGK